ncbi:MAG: LysM peptidoglycan-binding domain-containing protein [Thermoplasmata archaeon]|nr:LysM peptidoglycan-binding domain-containing protein [Thermoplasmata archaeon]
MDAPAGKEEPREIDAKEKQGQQIFADQTGITKAGLREIDILDSEGESNEKAASDTIKLEDSEGDEEERIDSAKGTDGKKDGSNGNHEDKNSQQEAVDDALALLNQSQGFWERGELDNALSLLDEAYSLIVSFDGDADLAWQKDDLRLLIAKRIIEIYTSRSNVAAGQQCEIPLVVNKEVENEIRRFQHEERKFFLHSYKRSGRYLPVIAAQIKEAGLPEELAWLPLVESGFKVKALSHARALGLWQFIPSTGYKFGLKRDLWIDERMDVEKSTQAAISYLKELHSIFGDWLTVLAAYNCGEGRVLRLISRQHMNYLDNFWDLYNQLPRETARYVPRFIAILNIIKEPQKFGFDLEKEVRDEPIPYETLITTKSVKLADIAGKVGISEDDLTALNPELRYKITPEKEYSLKMPPGTEQAVLAMIDRIPAAEKPGGGEFVRHKVRKGESLSSIAKRYGTSINAIMRANALSSRHTIRVGRVLKVPVRAYASYGKPASKPRGAASAASIMKYRVIKGDSLWGLAKRFDTTVSEIRSLNRLAGNSLFVGQELTIAQGGMAASGKRVTTYIVRKGDSPFSIAKKCNIGLEKLLSLNRMSKNDTIYPGQKLMIEN